MHSAILLRFFAIVIALIMGFVTFEALYTYSDLEEAAACFGFTVLNGGIAVAAHKRLRHLVEERRVFLLRFEGRPIEDALLLARAEAATIPSTLVEEKIDTPLTRRFAFERDGFQFVLAVDDEGRTKAFPIHL